MTSPIAPERLSELIGLIYDCALDPDLWPAAMEAICARLNLRTGVISLIDMARGHPLLAASTGFDAGWLERLPEYSEGLMPMWGGESTIRNLPLEEPAVLSRINPDAIAPDSTDRFHLGFNRPQGFVDAIAIALTRDESAIGTIGFNRHADFGLIGPCEIETMRLLVPHLQRAVAISRVLEMRRLAQQSLEDVLDGLDLPLVLVEADLQPRFLNAAAQTLLARHDFLLHTGAGLRFSDGATQRRLLAVMTDLLEGAGAASPFGLAFRDSQQNPWLVHLLPLHRKTSTRQHSPNQRLFALIFSAFSRTDSEAALQALAALYELTLAETRVLRLLCAGHPVRRIAAQLGIAPSTAKSHMLRIYEKTGLHRQADPVALVRSALAISL
ncbi:MAG: hypothetical protein ABS76_02285 [Pelagibacterium sp. SCN 64-44]|nr:MAG: hypothetical protein ABS76_02285 [Pelagibacterium sp. SCN 64-44]